MILSNFYDNFPNSFKLSNCSETFQLQKKLSNFAWSFPTSLGSFQPKQNFSNFRLSKLNFPVSRFFQLPFPATRIPPLYFWAVLGSLYFDRSMVTYILTGPLIPIPMYSDRSVDLYISEQSMDPFIQSGPWIPIILNRPWIALFLTGPWISIFWPVHGSLYSGRSMDSYIHSGTRGILIMRMTHFISLESIWLISPSPYPLIFNMTHNAWSITYWVFRSGEFFIKFKSTHWRHHPSFFYIKKYIIISFDPWVKYDCIV